MAHTFDTDVANAMDILAMAAKPRIDDKVLHVMTYMTKRDLQKLYRSKQCGDKKTLQFLGKYTQCPLTMVENPAFQANGIGLMVVCEETKQFWYDDRSTDDILTASVMHAGGPLGLEEITPIYMQSNHCTGCWVCGAALTAVSRCSHCKFARYCGVECQASHWAEHKKQCKEFR